MFSCGHILKIYLVHWLQGYGYAFVCVPSNFYLVKIRLYFDCKDMFMHLYVFIQTIMLWKSVCTLIARIWLCICMCSFKLLYCENPFVHWLQGYGNMHLYVFFQTPILWKSVCTLQGCGYVSLCVKLSSYLAKNRLYIYCKDMVMHLYEFLQTLIWQKSFFILIVRIWLNWLYTYIVLISCGNPSVHWLQVYGYVLMCSFKLLSCEIHCVHWLQWYGFASVCVPSNYYLAKVFLYIDCKNMVSLFLF